MLKKVATRIEQVATQKRLAKNAVEQAKFRMEQRQIERR